MKKLFKNKSFIDGMGIFILEEIGVGQVFYTVPLDHVFFKPRTHCAFIGSNRWVSDEAVLNFINHSCEPNTILDIQQFQPALLAKRDIKSGEEITVDYNDTELGGVKVPCNCGSKSCRGYFLRIE